ncbi:hypothetical protein SAMN05444413_12310 [Roseivivax marinus]|nr:hypothetical protein SAMN05444413_12310 [Roseivivax marinus]
MSLDGVTDKARFSASGILSLLRERRQGVSTGATPFGDNMLIDPYETDGL